jgi:hypothetical protein
VCFTSEQEDFTKDVAVKRTFNRHPVPNSQTPGILLCNSLNSHILSFLFNKHLYKTGCVPGTNLQFHRSRVHPYTLSGWIFKMT